MEYEKSRLLMQESSESEQFYDNSEPHGHNKAYNIFIDLIIFIIVTAEISLVLYLSIHHFQEAGRELEGFAMLFPILLNSIAVIYYLSDPCERNIIERTSSVKCFTDFYQFPIIGPVFIALKTLAISCGFGARSDGLISYGRVEASATKMRQAVGFFSAAPEILVQLSTLTMSEKDVRSSEAILEIAAVLTASIGLAEANVYSLLSPYYRIFHEYDKNDWRLEEISVIKKFILFLHAYTSIATSLIATVFVLASANYYFRGSHMAYISLLVVLGMIGYRMSLYYACRFLKNFTMRREIPSGCYQSINYGWRASILDFGFQSKNDFIQIWFYLEKMLAYVVWYSMATRYADPWVREMVLFPFTIVFWSNLIASIFFLLICQRFSLARLRSSDSDTFFMLNFVCLHT